LGVASDSKGENPKSIQPSAPAPMNQNDELIRSAGLLHGIEQALAK